MSLSSRSLTAGINWDLRKTNGTYATAKNKDRHTFSPTLPAGQNQLQSNEYTLTTSATQTIDLYATFTDLAGNAGLQATKVYGFLITVVGTNGGLTIEPGASNALTWFFGGTAPTVTIPYGLAAAPGCLMFFQPTAQVLDATHRNLKFTNTSGSASITFKITFLLGS